MISGVLSRITVGEIIVSVIMFIIVRTIIWCLRQVEKAATTEAEKFIKGHYQKRHKGMAQNCDSCTVASVDLSELTI